MPLGVKRRSDKYYAPVVGISKEFECTLCTTSKRAYEFGIGIRTSLKIQRKLRFERKHTLDAK